MLQRASQLEPDNLRITFNLARTLSEGGSAQQSLTKFDDVLSKALHYGSRPRPIAPLALAKLNRNQEALEEINRAYRLGFTPMGKNLGFWEGWRGTCLSAAGSYAEAIEPLERSMALSPEEPSTHYNLAVAYGELQRPEDAAKQFQECIRLASPAPDSLPTPGLRLRQSEAVRQSRGRLPSSPKTSP